MKKTFYILLYFHVVIIAGVTGQELYIFSDPASNVPAKSISAKYSLKLAGMRMHNTRTAQRHSPELMFGLNKNWMLRAGATFSDMFTNQVRLESGKLYAKYRFLSNDKVHKHFRMAAFAQYSQSRNELMFDELSLDGDQSGAQAGIIATQLWNKLAVSTTLSALQLTTPKHKYFPDYYSYQAFNYSLSAGLLVLPFEYTSYKQTNLNIYAELLGQQSLDKQEYYVDLAPAVQLIFNSTYKLNLGYRFQLKSNMIRMTENSFHISIEAIFLDALKRRRRVQ